MGLTSSKTNISNSTDSKALKEHINQVFKLNSIRSESAITDTLGYRNSTQNAAESSTMNTDSLTSLGISPGTAQAPAMQRGGAAFAQYQNRYKNFRLEKLFQQGGADSDLTESLGFVNTVDERKEADNVYVGAGGSMNGLTDSSEIEALRKILSSAEQKQVGAGVSPYAKSVQLSSTSSQPIDFSAMKGGNIDSETSVGMPSASEKKRDSRRRRRDRRSSSSTSEELADESTSDSVSSQTTETTEDTTEESPVNQQGGEETSTESLSESESTLSTTESIEKDDEDTESSSHTSEEARRRRRRDDRRKKRRDETTTEVATEMTGGRKKSKKQSKKSKKHKKMYSETSHGSVSEFNIVPFYSSENSSEYFRHMQNRNRFA